MIKYLKHILAWIIEELCRLFGYPVFNWIVDHNNAWNLKPNPVIKVIMDDWKKNPDTWILEKDGRTRYRFSHLCYIINKNNIRLYLEFLQDPLNELSARDARLFRRSYVEIDYNVNPDSRPNRMSRDDVQTLIPMVEYLFKKMLNKREEEKYLIQNELANKVKELLK